MKISTEQFFINVNSNGYHGNLLPELSKVIWDTPEHPRWPATASPEDMCFSQLMHHNFQTWGNATDLLQCFKWHHMDDFQQLTQVSTLTYRHLHLDVSESASWLPPQIFMFLLHQRCTKMYNAKNNRNFWPNFDFTLILKSGNA